MAERAPSRSRGRGAGTKAAGTPAGGEPHTGPKFRRRSNARPDEVLDAALDLFIEQGFATTRVEDIARRAGLSKGTVYLYFPSKQAILEGLVRRAVVPVARLALAEAAQFAGEPREGLSILLRALAQRLEDPRLLAVPKLIIREVVNFPELAEMYRREVLDQVIPVAAGMLERGMAQGRLRRLDPHLTIRSIVGPVLIHLLLAEVFGIQPEDGLGLDRLIENHLSILFDGLALPGEVGP